MKFGSSNILGLAIDDRQIVCAEVSPKNGVVRTARYERGNTTTSFSQFLKSHSITANKAVAGLPARWLMAREKQIPPSSPSVAADLLRMQAERQFSGEAKDAVFDYAGKADSDHPRTVLLLATLSEHLADVKKIAEEAELQLLAVTSTTLALSSVIGGDEGMLLSLGSESAELAVRTETGPKMLRHLATTNGHSLSQLGTIGTELLKAAAMGAAPSKELMVWDGMGLDDSGTATIESRSGLKVKRLQALPCITSTSPGEFGPAIALGQAGFKLDSLPVNFLKSRLAPPKQSRFGRTSLLIAAGVAVLVCGAASMVWDLVDKNSQLTEITARHDASRDKLKLAQANVDRTNYARGWYDKRTPVLDVLKAVTNAFPQLGDVWATTISVHENGKGLLSGRAVNQDSVLRVIDAMKRDKRFNDVTLMDMRDAGGTNRDTVFSLTFTFNEGTRK